MRNLRKYSRRRVLADRWRISTGASSLLIIQIQKISQIRRGLPQESRSDKYLGAIAEYVFSGKPEMSVL